MMQLRLRGGPTGSALTLACVSCDAASWNHGSFIVHAVDLQAAGACMALLRTRLGPDFIPRIGV